VAKRSPNLRAGAVVGTGADVIQASGVVMQRQYDGRFAPASVNVKAA
jgi:hypothetical protein